MTEHAYIHIPFCLRKCNYCSFISGANINLKNEYLYALNKEIKERYKKEKLKTLYIGGGTPSLLDVLDIDNIINLFQFSDNAEITLEVNPETVTKEKFLSLRESRVNRISLGIQTFNDKLLKIIGRNHTKETVYSAISIIKECGFKNISIDLIYGLPEQTIELWEKDLSSALVIDINHISTYGLKIEENSYFYNHQPKNLPDEELQAEMYKILCKTLCENKFEHYEISNFAKKNFESKHNCAYWRNKNYYGFGVNASGFEAKTRYRNESNLKKYIENPLEKEEEIILSDRENMENEIFLALRLSSGLCINEYNKKFNIDFISKYKKIINKYMNLHLLEENSGRIFLNENGFLLSNQVMSEFID